MPDLSTTITDAAAEPMSSSGDGQSVSNRSASDLVQADVYAGAGKSARRQRRRGALFSKAIPPGPISDQGQTIIVTPFDGGVS